MCVCVCMCVWRPCAAGGWLRHSLGQAAAPSSRDIQAILAATPPPPPHTPPPPSLRAWPRRPPHSLSPATPSPVPPTVVHPRWRRRAVATCSLSIFSGGFFPPCPAWRRAPFVPAAAAARRRRARAGVFTAHLCPGWPPLHPRHGMTHPPVVLMFPPSPLSSMTAAASHVFPPPCCAACVAV